MTKRSANVKPKVLRHGKAVSVLHDAAHESDSAVARKRREEIVSAAAEIIATEGIHRLSLARIEKRINMSRGQLTYYFPAKESILLAVFDRMLQRMIEEGIADAERSGAGKPGDGPVINRLKYGFERMMSRHEPDKTELASLVHTFMAQVQHRDDYRAKIAAANAGWREHLASDIRMTTTASVSPTIAASIIMALFQGLSGQLAVDAEAFHRDEMIAACVQLLSSLFGHTPSQPGDS